jgi:uncharacterized protein (TIGR00369 family)
MDMTDPSHDGWKPRTLPGFFGVVGPLWTKKEPAGWAYGLLAEGRHLNPAGIVHGGMLCTLLDHALSTVAWEANERKPCVTIAFDVQFVAPARADDFVVARGDVVRRTATLTFMRGALTVRDETVATASAVLKRI